jgi:hypothetical protein
LFIKSSVVPEFNVKALSCKVFATLTKDVQESAGHSPPPLSINVSISADVFSKITLKGASTVDYSFTTPTVTLTTIPVVASVPMAMGSSGGTFIDTLIDSGGGECPADSCTSLVRVANTLQDSALTLNSGTTEDLMNKYNHDTSNSDAAKEVFQYGKFTTVDGSGLTGLGSMIFEGAHDAAAAPAGEAAYVQSIERLEGSTVVIGKALE